MNELQITTTNRAILEDRGVMFKPDGVWFPDETIVFPQEIITTFPGGAKSTLCLYQLSNPHFLEVSVKCYQETWTMSIPTEGLMVFTTSQNLSPEFLKTRNDYANSDLFQTWSNEFGDFPCEVNGWEDIHLAHTERTNRP